MKILITGYKGFIGQNMVRALANKHELTLFEWGEIPPTIQGHDWVIHLGAISSTTETNVERIMLQNVDFSKWVFQECMKHGVNLQYSSSASVYGKNTTFCETDMVDPRSPYAWSKYLFDRHILQIVEHNTVNCIVQGFRYFNVWGPHEEHKGEQASPYTKFRIQAQETGEIKLFENSENYRRDFIHVDEVIDTHVKFFDVPESGIWNVGTGQPKSFLEVAMDISYETNAKIRLIPMPTELYHSYQTLTCADTTKLKDTLSRYEKVPGIFDIF